MKVSGKRTQEAYTKAVSSGFLATRACRSGWAEVMLGWNTLGARDQVLDRAMDHKYMGEYYDSTTVLLLLETPERTTSPYLSISCLMTAVSASPPPPRKPGLLSW